MSKKKSIAKPTEAGTPALQAFKREVEEKLAAEGLQTLEQWAEKRPGEHLPATYGRWASCALCGAVQPREGYRGQCKGVAKVMLRDGERVNLLQGAGRYGKSAELMRRACEAAKMGIDTVLLTNLAKHPATSHMLTLIGGMRREGAIRDEDEVRFDKGGSPLIIFKGGGKLFVTHQQGKGQRWAKQRGRIVGSHPEWMRESDAVTNQEWKRDFDTDPS